MRNFEDIGKHMPYTESEDYVRQLVSNATEKAVKQVQTVKQGQRAKVLPMRTWLAAAATATLLLAGIGITFYDKMATDNRLMTEKTEAPVEQFLNQLSDEEVQLLAYYEIEDIPEDNYN